MPMYEYSCRDCQHTFEALVFGDAKVECPECHGAHLERLISLPGMPRVENGAAGGGCGDLSLPPCGAPGCRRTGRA
jgi:putative FmdB family regulatory protein